MIAFNTTSRLRHLVLLAAAAVALPATVAADEATDLVKSCPRCHGAGEAAIPGWEPLKFQSREQLVDKLTTYRNQLVPESRMSDVTHHFSDADIEQIADYWSRYIKNERVSD